MLLSTITLSVGDPAPVFALPDVNELPVVLTDLAGTPSILFFYASDEIPGCRQIAQAFRDLMPTFTKFDVQILGISPSAPQLRQTFAKESNIPFPLLSDSDQSISQKYGVCLPADAKNSSVLTYHRAAFLLDANQRIVKIYSLTHLEAAIADILDDIKTLLPQEEPRHLTRQAPVLLIPNVFDRDFCRHLIDVWETQGNEDSGSMRRQGEKTVVVINYNHKIRRDHFIKDEKLLQYIDAMMNRRIFPEIKKAFHFEVSYREEYRIGCYDAKVGGFFRRHRDNTTRGTAHRRFAMTLNLNAGEYEGGYLKFPEYGPHLYKPDTGSAVIFSCSLMHEATDVTAGRRFVLVNFFYGDKEAQERNAYERQVENNYSTAIRLTEELPQSKVMYPI